MPNIMGNRAKIINKSKTRPAKIPYKRFNRINGVKLDANVISQNRLRARMKTISKALGLKPVKEIGTGVDYKAIIKRGKIKKGITLDLKFSFGAMGEGVIAIRIKNKRLINNANYAFAIGRNNQLHVFKMGKLEQFVKQHFGKLPASQKVDRGNHDVYPLNLSEFYKTMKINPIIVPFNSQGVNTALKTIRNIELPQTAEPAKPKSLPEKKIIPTNNSQKKQITPKRIPNPISPKTIIRTGARGK